MRRRWMIALALLLTAPVALAASVTIDYDHSLEFGTYTTFSYVESKESLQAKNPLMADRVKAGVIKMGQDAGMELVDENPDLHLTYHVSSTEGYNMQTTGMGYGMGMGGWGWGGSMGTSSTMVTTYTEGTIIVDAVDVERNELIWRGTATQVMKAKPQKQQQQLEKALLKMLSKWEQIKAKGAQKKAKEQATE